MLIKGVTRVNYVTISERIVKFLLKVSPIQELFLYISGHLGERSRLQGVRIPKYWGGGGWVNFQESNSL